MKKQIVPFCKWVTTMLAQYMQWNDDARAQKPASEAKPGQRQQRGKSPHPSTPSSSTTTSSKPSSDQSTAAVEALLKLDPGLDLRDAPTPAYGKPVGGQLVVLSRVALIRKVSLATSAGPLVLRNLRCWVDETDEELNITIGRPMMERLGYSVDAFLVAALTKQPEYDGGGGAPLSPDSSPMLKMQRLQYQACYDPPSSSEATALEDFALTPKFESDDVASQRVQELFVKGLKEAVALWSGPAG
ncbi:hypothetical protein PR002_g19297 [Phytophthora rubi]|uniref:Uncharacterized protein n=1 Tax=Phytophthora rubi TaxID=129364 RepID=A0A6A3JT08_9STRA|nr:hypothetical protein PR002_g19297 [Phytophthora rubi]